MAFQPPESPSAVIHTKIRNFKGIGGPRYEVIRKANDKGWDISNDFANEVYDFNLGIIGMMRVREGKVKINNTGKTATINSLFSVNIGGNRAYAYQYGQVLDVIDIPESEEVIRNSFGLDPAPTKATLTDDKPKADPSVEP